MTLKPLKKSEQKKLIEDFKMKQRRENMRDPMPLYYLIVCEGKETEPNYFEGIKEKINAKYKGRVDVKEEKINLRIEGEGDNTLFLLARAKKYTETSLNKYSHVWLVYDLDSFPKDNFDNTQFKAESMSNEDSKWHVAWSNQCIELWFLLHFIPLVSDISREDYKIKLHEHFKEMGYEKYEKNLKNIYDILMDKTQTAIRYSERLYESYDEKVPSKMGPATRVHELVKDLLRYL
jgi:hypothetical protein